MFLCTTKTTTGMCFTCCEENIPIIICKQSKCDYAMCKKCYKKYYSKNDKCPACRNINNNNTYHIFKKMSHNLYECFLILTEFAPFTIIIISFFLIIAILFLLGRLLFFLFFSLVTKTTIASIIKYYWTTDIALFAISSFFGLFCCGIFTFVLGLVLRLIYLITVDLIMCCNNEY